MLMRPRSSADVLAAAKPPPPKTTQSKIGATFADFPIQEVVLFLFFKRTLCRYTFAHAVKSEERGACGEETEMNIGCDCYSRLPLNHLS